MDVLLWKIVVPEGTPLSKDTWEALKRADLLYYLGTEDESKAEMGPNTGCEEHQLATLKGMLATNPPYAAELRPLMEALDAGQDLKLWIGWRKVDE